MNITAFTPAPIAAATRLSQAEEWPHRPEDWAFNLTVSQGIVAWEGDRVVGTALDRQVTGMNRAALLERMATDGHLLRTDGGIAVLRRFGRGHVLGPVLARHPDAAAALLTEAASRMRGRFLRLDMPDDAGLADLADRLGLSHMGGGITMHLNPGPQPVTGAWRTFGLISQAMG